MPDSPAPPLPPRVTTPLLTYVTQQSLDEDYQHVAEQRRAGLRPPGDGASRSRLTVAALAIFGVLLAIAAVQTARNADVVSAGREQLISRIEARNDTVASLQSQIGSLRRANSAADRRVRSLERRLDDTIGNRDALARAAGFAALEGDGVRAVVDDAPGGGEGIVRDDDLALLVNALWAAGAEGIAVNGQRVTAVSALRNSAQVVRINSVSLSPPYVVEAVGDTHTLQAKFAQTASGLRFGDLAKDLGMPFSMDNVDGLTLPAAPDRLQAVRKARPLTVKRPPTTEEDR